MTTTPGCERIRAGAALIGSITAGSRPLNPLCGAPASHVQRFGHGEERYLCADCARSIHPMTTIIPLEGAVDG